jgi:hypothetical protein
MVQECTVKAGKDDKYQEAVRSSTSCLLEEDSMNIGRIPVNLTTPSSKTYSKKIYGKSSRDI